MKNKSQNKKIEKVAMASENIENENLQKLRAVFPNFVKDGVIDFDVLQAFLKKEGILAGDEKYGLSWAGKSNAFRAIRTQATGTFVPQEKENKDWDKTENLFIEGDNLEVLKLLQKRYRGEIKMIYIDPPYNTGKDFIYKDNFTKNISNYYKQTGQTKNGIRMTANAERSGRYHSDWLTMMYPRLFLASNLLKDDGIIFVSIDDNEIHNLRLIMDEIFGEENFITQFVWHNNVKGRQMDLYIKNTYESILVYSKSFENVFVNTSKKSINVDNLEKDNISYYKKDYPLHNGTSEFHINNRPNLAYSIYYSPKTGDAKIIDEKKKKNDQFIIGKPIKKGLSLIDSGYVRIIPKYNNTYGNQRVWRWGKEKFLREYKTELIFVKEDSCFYIYQKKRFKNGIHEKTFKNYINIDGGIAKKELFDILGIKIFENPKPVLLIKHLIKIGLSNDDIILDFFAGSGTTAQAVMELNAEDNENRKWICVQLPELTDEKSEAYKAGYKNIAEICKGRIRRAGAKISKGDIGFKSYKLSSSNYRQWNNLTVDDDEQALKKQIKLFVDKPLVDSYDEKAVVFEVLLKEGFDLNAKVEQIKVGSLQLWKVTETDKRLFITFAAKVIQKQVNALDLTDQDMFVCLDKALDDTTKINLIKNVKVKVI